MKWAGFAFSPLLVACVIAAPAPSEPAPPAGAAQPTAEVAAPVPLSASTPKGAPTPTSASSPSVAPASLPPIAVEASFEPTRSVAPARRPEQELSDVETRSVNFGASVTIPCIVGGRPAQCIELADGPWLVSDYEALDGCPSPLYLAGAAKSDLPAGAQLELAWTIRVTAQGVHGARVAVPGNGKLLAAIESRRRHLSARCSITWSGYRSPKGSGTQPALMESPYR